MNCYTGEYHLQPLICTGKPRIIAQANRCQVSLFIRTCMLSFWKYILLHDTCHTRSELSHMIHTLQSNFETFIPLLLCLPFHASHPFSNCYCHLLVNFYVFTLIKTIPLIATGIGSSMNELFKGKGQGWKNTGAVAVAWSCPKNASASVGVRATSPTMLPL